MSDENKAQNEGEVVNDIKKVPFWKKPVVRIVAGAAGIVAVVAATAVVAFNKGKTAGLRQSANLLPAADDSATNLGDLSAQVEYSGE